MIKLIAKLNTSIILWYPNRSPHWRIEGMILRIYKPIYHLSSSNVRFWSHFVFTTTKSTSLDMSMSSVIQTILFHSCILRVVLPAFAQYLLYIFKVANPHFTQFCPSISTHYQNTLWLLMPIFICVCMCVYACVCVCVCRGVYASIYILYKIPILVSSISVSHTSENIHSFSIHFIWDNCNIIYMGVRIMDSSGQGIPMQIDYLSHWWVCCIPHVTHIHHTTLDHPPYSSWPSFMSPCTWSYYSPDWVGRSVWQYCPGGVCLL